MRIAQGKLMSQQPKKMIENLLSIADVQINGSRPWDIQVHDSRLYGALLMHGSLGLGEAYMQSWWDAASLDQFFDHVLSARLDQKVKFNWDMLIQVIKHKIINSQSKKHAFEVGEQHYDLGNNLYEAMLDSRLVYTCGYWKNANNLEEAQKNKLALTCQKLQLKPGMKILDIGCGFGSFAKYAAENYDVSVVGITISKEQLSLGKKLCEGLNITLRLQDYRDLLLQNEQFDRIVSLGMFEHVGTKNDATYMKVAHHCLKDQGLFLLHTIGNAEKTMGTDPWITKYIFPNSRIPTMVEIAKAVENKFIVEDWHNFGAYYDQTLMAWHQNFISHWDVLKSQYSNQFKRMWEYYLLSCAGAFRSRNVQLWQILMSKGIVKHVVETFR